MSRTHRRQRARREWDLADFYDAVDARRDARRSFKETVEACSREQIEQAWNEDLLTVELYEQALKIKQRQELASETGP